MRTALNASECKADRLSTSASMRSNAIWIASRVITISSAAIKNTDPTYRWVIRLIPSPEAVAESVID